MNLPTWKKRKILAEKLRLLELEAKQNNDTSDDMEKAKAAAYAAFKEADTEYYNGKRRLDSQYLASVKEVNKEEQDLGRTRGRSDTRSIWHN